MTKSLFVWLSEPKGSQDKKSSCFLFLLSNAEFSFSLRRPEGNLLLIFLPVFHIKKVWFQSKRWPCVCICVHGWVWGERKRQVQILYPKAAPPPTIHKHVWACCRDEGRQLIPSTFFQSFRQRSFPDSNPISRQRRAREGRVHVWPQGVCPFLLLSSVWKQKNVPAIVVCSSVKPLVPVSLKPLTSAGQINMNVLVIWPFYVHVEMEAAFKHETLRHDYGDFADTNVCLYYLLMENLLGRCVY